MTDLPPRRRAQAAPPEPPLGELGPSTAHAAPNALATITEKPEVPRDVDLTVVKTLKMSPEHVRLLNELKLLHNVKIQEAVWYAIENTYVNK